MDAYRRAVDHELLWLKGEAEVVVEIYFLDATKAIEKLSKSFTGNRQKWRNCGIIDCDPIWFNTSAEIITWDRETIGDRVQYVWYESDGGPSTSEEEICIEYKTTGIKYCTKREIKEDDEQLGKSFVEYCDNTSGDGSIYNTGDITFRIAQK
jgi:hypothetical protein